MAFSFFRRAKPGNSWRASKSKILNVSARSGGARNKDHMYKIGAIVLALLALSGVAWAAKVGLDQIGMWMFSENDRYVLRDLDVKSTGRLPAANICEYGHLSAGQNLFAINLDETRRALEKVPVIKSVELQRVLPDALIVRVKERVPVARLGADDRINHFAVDGEGFVLGPSSRSVALPVITGLTDPGILPGSQVTNALLSDALLTLDTCDAAGLSPIVRISSLDISNPEYLTLYLANNMRVLMARTDVRRRLGDLARMIQEIEARGASVAFLDLTVNRNVPARMAER